MTYLLDTDICAYWLRNREPVRSRLATVDPAQVSISSITLCELRYGADSSARPLVNHQSIDAFAANLAILTVDERVARVFGEIKAELRRTGLLLEDFDLLIASTALVNNLTLVTNNSAHYGRIHGLSLENWMGN